MQKFLRVTVLTVSALCLACTSPSALGGHEAAEPTRPLLVLTGADSRVSEPAYHRVTSEEAWQKLWLSHLGKTENDKFREHLPIAQIDFERCMVIAMFKGAATNSRGLNGSCSIRRFKELMLRAAMEQVKSRVQQHF